MSVDASRDRTVVDEKRLAGLGHAHPGLEAPEQIAGVEFGLQQPSEAPLRTPHAKGEDAGWQVRARDAELLPRQVGNCDE